MIHLSRKTDFPAERDESGEVESPGSEGGSPHQVHYKLLFPLQYMESWSHNTRCSVAWESKFFSKRVRVTHGGMLTILCNKFKIDPTPTNRAQLVHRLQWRCFGSLLETRDNLRRKFVGISRKSSTRRDFVRICGRAHNTCLSAQILMFVEISGFDNNTPNAIVLPQDYRSPVTNTHSVVFALIRWLSPHPEAILRDDGCRPICSPPFDINHVLWEFTKESTDTVSTSVLQQNIMFYDGDTMEERFKNGKLECKTKFDLIIPESFDKFMNCTRINIRSDHDTILETITIPFN